MQREQIDQLATDLMAKQRAARVAEHSKIWEPLSTTATDLGYECERRIVYHRCYPKDAAPYGDELLSIFSEGDLHAKDVKRELGDLGYELVEQEVRFSDKRLDLAGSIDAKIVVSGGRDTHQQERIPLEIKSTAGTPPTDEVGLRESCNGLFRKYWAQMQAYLLLTNSPFGMFLFKDKLTGLWVCFTVELDYERAEKLLRRAERVRDRVRLIVEHDESKRVELLPDRIPDRSECGGCPWRETLCHPADAEVDPVLLAMEPGLLAQLEEREKVSASRDRYEALDKALKDRMKLTKFDKLVVGGANGFLVEKKIQKNGTRFNIRRLTAPADPTDSGV
jgi:hypothetical protein